MDTTPISGVEGDDRDEHTDSPLPAPFDQTNGLADGLEGESDGTADGDEESEADREQDARATPLFGELRDDDGVKHTDDELDR